MKARWRLVGSLGVVAVAVALVGTRSKEPSVASIAAEPVAPRVAEESAQQESHAGVALPLRSEPSTRLARPSKGLDRTTLEVDTIEPWTGEDLAPVVVAARTGRPRFDRVDPWNTSVVHEVNPAHMLPIDESDPWNDVVSLKKTPAPPKTQLALEKSSPWTDEPASSPVTSL